MLQIDLRSGRRYVHDHLISYDFVLDELNQREESGHVVTAIRTRLESVDPGDTSALETLLDELADAPAGGSWDFEEPEELADIIESLPSRLRFDVPDSGLDDRIRGGWFGRIAGCNLGKPLELGSYWTTDRIRDYLERADAWPLRDYVPALDPMPQGFELRECWPETTRGNVNGSARDDDIDYAILGLDLLERHGRDLSSRHVADAWLRLFPFHQIYTAERAAYANLIAGVPLAEVASHRNPYREWIGALIRGDAFGWANPGRPVDAMSLAYQDARLSHRANGVYGELWSAAIVACAFTCNSAIEAFEMSLECIPPRSRLSQALRDVQSMHRAGQDWEDAIIAIQQGYGHYSWVHTISNAALIAAGILWSENDFASAVGLTVQGGWDTDSNGATTGSVLGVVTGAARLPRRFIDPLHDRTRSALFGFDNSAISELAQRTLALARTFAQ
jgi:ADP-ribosylglycohydrolase